MSEWEARVYKKVVKMTREQQKEWRELRHDILIRDHYKCQRCEKISHNGKGLTVHHIIPRDEGGLNDPLNLITLCHSCHDLVEISGFRLLSEICTVDDKPVGENKYANRVADNDHGIIRPAWHKYVYGGVHR